MLACMLQSETRPLNWGNVVRALNINMVLAYWLIGREIVQQLQGGKGRAKYGERIVEDLCARLTERYGKGFSERNLQWFKQFYLAYKERFTILHPMGAESGTTPKLNPPGAELVSERTWGQFSYCSISARIIRPTVARCNWKCSAISR